MRRPLVLLGLGLAACGGPPAEVPRSPAFVVQEIRPTETERDPLWSFEPGDVVESFDGPGGEVRIHFTRAGRHAVPSGDADGDGVPDYVQTVAEAWEAARAFYAELGFRQPLSDEGLAGDVGGDGRFDVYLLDFALSSDGSFVAEACPPPGDRCIGYAVQENDFAGYHYPNRRVASRVLASHEGFHAVQAAYDQDQGVVFSEATAVWATEAFDPSLDDFEGFVHGYLDDPGRSIDVPPPGPVPAFAYGAAIFFRFLEERYDRALIRSLVERTEDGQGLPGGPDGAADPAWLPQLDLLLARDHGSSFGEAFREFASWNLHTGAAADPERAYAEGARYPEVALEAETLPLEDDRFRVFHAATEYRSFDPGARTELVARLVALPGTAGAELEGLSLLVALRAADGTLSTVASTDDVERGISLPLAGEPEAIVGVINRAYAGDSKKPGICVGDPGEVAACVELLVPGGGEGGSGGAGGSGGEGAGGSGGDGGTGGSPDVPRRGGGGDGGGCASAGGSLSLAGLAAALALLGRRRR